MFSPFSSRPFFLLFPFFSVFLSFFLDTSGPRAITRFLTEPLMRICCCILLLDSFSYLYVPPLSPLSCRRVFAWTLAWLLFPDASLVLKFSYVAFQCLGTYHRFRGVPKCSLHFWRFRFLNASLRFTLFPLDHSSFSSRSFLCFFPSSYIPVGPGPLPAS